MQKQRITKDKKAEKCEYESTDAETQENQFGTGMSFEENQFGIDMSFEEESSAMMPPAEIDSRMSIEPTEVMSQEQFGNPPPLIIIEENVLLATRFQDSTEPIDYEDFALLEIQMKALSPLKGITNSGQTCFLNAVIQCLRVTPG